MSQSLSQSTTRSWNRSQVMLMDATLVVAATLFVALSARVTIVLPFTPVPLTLQNGAVLLVGLLLGARRGALALALYLAEGASGLPVFNPHGLGGIAQLLGPTGGYLLSYPMVAYVAGWSFARRTRTFTAAALSSTAAEILLFMSGVSWLMVGYGASFAQAFNFGLFPFVAFEVLKVAAAAGIAAGWNRAQRH